jgi:hypothetical protein
MRKSGNNNLKNYSGAKEARKENSKVKTRYMQSEAAESGLACRPLMDIVGVVKR